MTYEYSITAGSGTAAGVTAGSGTAVGVTAGSGTAAGGGVAAGSEMIVVEIGRIVGALTEVKQRSPQAVTSSRL